MFDQWKYTGRQEPLAMAASFIKKSSLALLGVAFCLLFFSVWNLFTPVLPSSLLLPPPAPMLKSEWSLNQALFAQLPSEQLPWSKEIQIYFFGFNERPDLEEKERVVSLSEHIGLKSVPERFFLRKLDKEWRIDLEEGLIEAQFVIESGRQRVQLRHLEDQRTITIDLKAGKELWLLDGVRVDTSWLLRHQMVYVGEDRFLVDQGGGEWVGKQRIDFNAEGYCVFCGEKEGLAWEGGKWHAVAIGSASRGLPLLVFEAKNERTLQGTFWSPEGAFKVHCLLTKSMGLPPKGAFMVRFLSSKSAQQWVCLLKEQKVIVGVHDWWLFADGQWRKLATREEIESFVDRQIQGELFVVQALENHRGKRMISGQLYNMLRTQSIPCEVNVQGGVLKRSSEKGAK